MYYYIKYRKKGSSKTKCYRRDGKILVFSNHNTALDFVKNFEEEDLAYTLANTEFPPNNRKSPLWKRDFELIV